MFWTRIPIMMSLMTAFFDQLSTSRAFMVGSPTRRIRQQQCAYLRNDRRNVSRKNNIVGGGNDRGYGDGSVSAEDTHDNVMLLPILEAELAKLKASLASQTTKEEGLLDDLPIEILNDNRQIQELEEKIDNARTAAEFGIRKAQAEFYDAFSGQSLHKMKDVWSRSDDVCCVHPGMEKLQGSAAVIQSWEQIFAGFRDEGNKTLFQIEPSRVKINICGQTAICSCVEEVNGAKLEALNIYRREDGKWRMTMHMASPTIMQSGGSALL